MAIAAAASAHQKVPAIRDSLLMPVAAWIVMPDPPPVASMLPTIMRYISASTMVPMAR